MSADDLSRRTVLRWAGAAGMMAVTSAVASACAPPSDISGGDENGLVLLPGFSSRIIARGSETIPGTGVQYRLFPDGASTFADPAVPGGWYLVTNHEVPFSGGVTSIRFARDGTVISARSILDGTSLNCAGGATPWGTWLSCEEFDLGLVYECDPTGARPPRVLPGLGAFSHEAAAVARDGRVYLTEDRPDGAFYRFTPDRPGDLGAGRLEIATGPSAPGRVTWELVPDPSGQSAPCRRQVRATMAFRGGEGIDTLGGVIWFTTKGDERVWRYDLGTSVVSIEYQAGSGSLDGVDNLWVDEDSNTLFVAEDGGNMQLVVLREDGTTRTLVRLLGQDASEVTGPCFSPDGERLYFSSQRGPVGLFNAPFGITYEVSGPFKDVLVKP